ncbi:hypothetical protein PDIDSM_2024 [Penicillium digitatum]|nr:hypothetical protein PDIDSM_2024 [Penicillium digitatum]
MEKPHSRRAGKARAVAQHIRNLARTTCGRRELTSQAVITCVIPSLTFGTEAWYGGRNRPAKQASKGTVRARVGWHINVIESTLALAIRGVLPVWRTTPTSSLFRDAGIPSGYATLEEAKLRFALRLKHIHKGHTLVRRIRPPMITRGRGTGTRQPAKTIIQRLGSILPEVPRPTLSPRTTHRAAEQTLQGLAGITPIHRYLRLLRWLRAVAGGIKYVGYGFVLMVTAPKSTLALALSTHALMFSTLKQSEPGEGSNGQSRTSVIWCIRGNASNSSQWAFLACHRAMEQHNITGEGALRGSAIGMEAEPTISGIRSIFRELRNEARLRWWDTVSQKLSQWYRRWSDTYEIDSLPELELRRPALHRWLASARRMATSTGTTASSTTKTPNSTAHAAAESHQSTSLSATKPRGLSDTGQNAPRHLQPTG